MSQAGIDPQPAECVVAVTRDITAQRSAEELRGWLAAIVHTSVDAIVSKDLNGIITSWNEAAERIFGYPAAAAIGQPITMLIPPHLLDEETYIIERIRRGERVVPYDTKRRRQDGTLLDVAVAVSPILDSRGTVIGASKIARDITERIKMQEALQQANRHKDEFLAMLAHELRNPLAPIRMGLEAFKRVEIGSPAGEQTLAMMERQVQQLGRLVDDLMDVGRISAGQLELRKERLVLNSVLNSAIETCRPLIEQMGHKLTLALPAEPVVMNADQTRLAQVMVNLLNNAAKYTPAGGQIGLHVEVQGGEVRIAVRDSGVGIPAAALPRIFDMFTQVDAARHRSQGGLGIGLSLVKRLVELHGGSVEAHSEGAGQGAEFIVRLPWGERATKR